MQIRSRDERRSQTAGCTARDAIGHKENKRMQSDEPLATSFMPPAWESGFIYNLCVCFWFSICLGCTFAILVQYAKLLTIILFALYYLQLLLFTPVHTYVDDPRNFINFYS